MKILLAALFALLISFSGITQDFRITEKKAAKTHIFYPRQVSNFYDAGIKPIQESPYPNGKDYRSYLMDVKSKYAEQHKPRYFETAAGASRAEQPQIIQDFGTYWNHPTNGPSLHDGGGPNDNSMAFSNDAYLMTSWNSVIYAHDLQADTPSFNTNPYLTTLSFQQFAGDITTSSPFDPKILYDPQENKFVLLFLSGRGPNDSKTVIGFSTTSNPVDPWNVYEIDGNPLNNNTWTDYPQVALTTNELFYTVNLLKAGQSWIAGFDRTIIWQIDKHSGFKGEDSLKLNLWDSIYYDNKPVRYFRPIKTGAGPAGPNMYFLSNRGVPVEWNDTKVVENDTVFLIEVNNERGKSPKLSVKPLKANQTYQTPTNATQAEGHIFFTNDSRILGGFYNNNQIQFVGNTMDKTTNRPAVYHGVIKNVNSTPTLKLKNISSGTLDYGFPNIAYTGIKTSNQSSVIGFNHTSETAHAGFSCVYYDGSGSYSATKMLVEGDSLVDMNGWSNGDRTYERWGDYFGIQRNFRSPKQVWLNGYYGKSNRRSSAWIVQVKVPFDANDPDDGVDTSYNPVSLNEYKLQSKSKVYPNPSNGSFKVRFNSTADQFVSVKINSISGSKSIELLQGNIKSGTNELSFQTFDLAKGIYLLDVSSTKEILLNKKIVIE